MASDWVLDKSLIEEAVRACEEHGYDAIAIHNVSDSNSQFLVASAQIRRESIRVRPINFDSRFFQTRCLHGSRRI